MHKSLPLSVQVLFDDIGPSVIRVDRPDLQLQLILSFLQFLGLPGPSGRFSTTSSSNILLDDLTFLEEGPDPERPLTCYDLPMAGICAVGHMTFLGNCRRQAGLCKAGEEFLQNVLQQTLPLVSAKDQAVITLCWLQYEKLKVCMCETEKCYKTIISAFIYFCHYTSSERIDRVTLHTKSKKQNKKNP